MARVAFRGGTLEIRDLALLRKRASPLRRLWMVLGGLTGKRTISIFPMEPGFMGSARRPIVEAIDTALDAWEREQLGLGPVPRQIDGEAP